MQPDHNPNPQRFEVFTQIPSGKGFRIKDSRYIYLFDRYGGWYDEYNNYYNADGQNEEPPSDEDDDFQRVVLDDSFGDDGDDDYYDREYGGTAHDDHDDDDLHPNVNEHQKTLEAISHNGTILHQYPVKTALRVDFENMSFKATKQEVLKHYRSKIGNGILNVILTQSQGKFNGEGYFVCKDVSVAEKLIKYEGEQFLGRKIFFDVEPVEENLADPVTKEEMDIAVNEDDFEPLVKEKPVQAQNEDSKNPKKKYFAKGHGTQIKKQQSKNIPAKQQKAEQPKKEQKVIKTEQPKKEQKREPTWSKYYGEVTMFPKKTSFKDWMSSLGFNENEHFKNPEKADSKDANKKFATVELRSDVYQKIQRSLYQNQEIHFQKLN